MNMITLDPVLVKLMSGYVAKSVFSEFASVQPITLSEETMKSLFFPWSVKFDFYSKLRDII